MKNTYKKMSAAFAAKGAQLVACLLFSRFLKQKTLIPRKKARHLRHSEHCLSSFWVQGVFFYVDNQYLLYRTSRLNAPANAANAAPK